MTLEELQDVLSNILRPAQITLGMGTRLTVPDKRMIHATAAAMQPRRTKLKEKFVIDEVLQTTDERASTRGLHPRVLAEFTAIVRDEITVRRNAVDADVHDTPIPTLLGEPSMAALQKPETKSLNILFMDLSGWSRLTAVQIARYVQHGFPAVNDLIKKHNPSIVNTWGDAIVAAFDSTRIAAECALDIKHFFGRADWEHNLPEGVHPRIALHTGEVIVGWNPIIEKQDLFGDTVHKAARLEPVTEKGQVFCTDDFARALNAIKGMGAAAHYVQELELAKGYGNISVYVVLGQGETPPEPKTPPNSDGASPGLSGVSARPAFR